MRSRLMHSLWLLPLFGLACQCGKDPAPHKTEVQPNVAKPAIAKPADDFISLFDGKSLDGWKIGKNA